MVDKALLYVHGAGKQKSAAALRAELDKILFGATPFRTSVAYYAHVRWPTTGGSTSLGTSATARARRARAVRAASEPDRGPTEAAELIVRATLAASGVRPVGAAGLSPADRLAARDLAASLFRNADRVARRSAMAAPGPAAGPTLPDPIFRAIVGFFASDVIDYLFGGFHERMREPVRKALRAAPAPTVIVAHSLGTIITYDVLSEPEFRNRALPMLVTVGSPLGIGNVRAWLRDGAGEPNPVPKGVKSWLNFADRFDPVALDATLADAFEPPVNFPVDEAVNNRAFNNHDLTGYLAIGVVGTVIRQAMA